MSIPIKHLRHQAPVIGSLARTAFDALRKQRGKSAGAGAPGAEEIRVTIPPRASDLIRDYVRAVGGDPSAYRKTVPPHLFPQWGFALAARTLSGQPYPLFKALNGGCRLEVNAPLPAGVPLRVTAKLEGVDDNGKRVILHQRVATGTDDVPDAVVGHLYAIIPLEKPNRDRKNGAPRKEKPRVPQGAQELAYWRIPADAGLQFALLTGDINPLHWIRPYARAMGFRSTILHGFSTMARAYEGLCKSLYAGRTTAIRTFDVKFTRPLVLPARVGLYVDGNAVYVGDAPGGPAYMVGTYEAIDSLSRSNGDNR